MLEYAIRRDQWGRGKLALGTTRAVSLLLLLCWVPQLSCPTAQAPAFPGSSEALANQHFCVNVVQDLHQKLWFPDKHLFA